MWVLIFPTKRSSHFSFCLWFLSIYCCRCLSGPRNELGHNSRFPLTEFDCQSRLLFSFVSCFDCLSSCFCFCEMCHLLNTWNRSIRCLRNIIHWNLITTFILRNVMWFLLQLIDHNIHESNEVATHQTNAVAAKRPSRFLKIGIDL